MSTPQQPSSGLKISPGDIIYTLFRHLKKIIFFAIAGVIAGAVTYKLWPTTFQSNAKLMIRFVTEDRGINDTEQDLRTVSFGARGTGYIINGEIAILTSLDLAKRVVDDLGAEAIITDPEKEATPASAAGVIMRGLEASNSRGTNMINLSFSNENAELAPKILNAVIENYQLKHLEIHRGSGTFDDYITRETDQMRLRLQQTEEEINAVKANAGIFNIADSKQRISQNTTQISNEMLQTQTLIAELKTLIAQQESDLPSVTDSAQEEVPNQPPEKYSESELSGVVREHASLTQKLDFLKGRERQLSLQYTDENSLLKVVRGQLEETESRLAKLVQDYPSVLGSLTASAPIVAGGLGNTVLPNNLRDSKLRLVAAEAKLDQLKLLLGQLGEEATRIDRIEITINELQRRKALQESKYNSLLESMERARVQEELGDGRINNIGIIQAPSPAYVAANKRLEFSAGITVGVGIIGLVWAFLVDLLLDRSIKRPTEIQRNLGIPLFMSLPDLSDKRYRKANPKANRQALLQAGKARQQKASKANEAYKPKSPTLQAAALAKPENYGDASNSGPREIAPWDDQHALNGHFDALRDKVITYFESKNLTHKPKLIAMTGLGQESGVTTIASGLAGSLSKIGEGNVLLVDMTLGHETAQRFYNGKNILNLDQVLDQDPENDAKVENRLYVVAEGTNGTKLPRIMPQRFNKIMPKLRASDFDYIIFDMPPVSPISSTPRLASFMDVVLMVMESEETNRDVANQALELLADSKAHLGGILNKTKSHVPRKLEQDLLSQA